MFNSNAVRYDDETRLADYSTVIGVGIQFAFQPVVHLGAERVIGYEALVRGRSGEPASSIIANIRPDNLSFFDQACRTRAIQDASELGVQSDLFINCTQINPDNLIQMLSATRREVLGSSLRAEQIVLEFANLARLGTPRELARVRDQANACGFRVLADNYGTGEAGLKRLAVFRPEYAKLDREIVNQVNASKRRQAIVLGIVATCQALGVTVIATGVERLEEIEWLHEKAGVQRFQGYYFARPELLSKPLVDTKLMQI